MHPDKRKYILDLIEKLQEANATEVEIKFLTDFYLSHQESDYWPINIESKNIIRDKVFKNIHSTIYAKSKEKVKVIPFYRRDFFKYGVAACMFVLISITFLIKNEQPKANSPTIVNSLIEIGSNKAILTLQDGTLIPLENNKLYKAENVSSDGEILVYRRSAEQFATEMIYNVLTIPRGGQFFVQLSDGTKVWLNSESQLKYPVTFASGKPRHVELVYGEAYFDVSSSKYHNGSKFVLESRHQEVEVIGTEFNVTAYADEALIYTTLVEGKVTVAIGGENKQNLNPNQQAVVNPKTHEILIKIVDVHDNISWKDGEFGFNHMPLKNIMKVLSRWYDVDIKFENKGIETLEFNGVLRKDQQLEDILEIIKSTNDLNFEIKNKTIILK